jgi:hypothetical protein
MTERRGPLTRGFIVTESIFEKDGANLGLPKLVGHILSESVWSRSDPLTKGTSIASSLMVSRLDCAPN